MNKCTLLNNFMVDHINFHLISSFHFVVSVSHIKFVVLESWWHGWLFYFMWSVHRKCQGRLKRIPRVLSLCSLGGGGEVSISLTFRNIGELKIGCRLLMTYKKWGISNNKVSKICMRDYLCNIPIILEYAENASILNELLKIPQKHPLNACGCQNIRRMIPSQTPPHGEPMLITP